MISEIRGGRVSFADQKGSRVEVVDQTSISAAGERGTKGLTEMRHRLGWCLVAPGKKDAPCPAFRARYHIKPYIILYSSR